MKKLLRKISAIVAITVLATTLSVCTGMSASAATGSLLTPGQEGLLRVLGVVTEKNPNYDKALTRGELAHLGAKIANAPAYTGTDYYFYDVMEDNPYFADIYALGQMGVLSGDGDGYFRPNDTVSDIEICKVFSVLLGYKEAGEYMSFLRIARDAEITEGVTMDGVVTYGEALAMAYNTLHADMFEAITYGDTKEFKKNEGFLAIECYHGLVKQDGIVKGVQYTTLIEPTDMIPAGSIQINNRIFNWDDPTLLGKYVNFYSKKDGSSTAKDIFYLFADETRNNMVTIEGEDVIGIEDGQLKYWVGAKDKGYKLALAPDVIVNGVAFPGFDDEDLKPATGTITLIDNDDDELYDVITVDDIEYMVYQSQDKENKILYGKYPQDSAIGGKGQINDITLTGEYGPVNLGTLTEGTVLRYRKSKNTTGTVKVTMTKMEDIVTGQVTSFMDDTITVNDTIYKVTTGTVIDETVRLGETVSIYPDGDAAAVILHASNDVYQFAYLLGARNSGGGFNGELSVRLIDQNYEIREFAATKNFYMDEIKYNKVDAAMQRLSDANALRAYNDDMTLGTADADGNNELDRMKNGDAEFPYAQPIRFRLNDEGMLTHIDTIIYERDYEREDSLQPAETGKSEVRRLAYASYPNSFYNQAGSELIFTALGMNRAMRVLQDDRDEVEYFRSTIIDGHYPVVEAFNVDPLTKVAKYLMIYDTNTAANDLRYNAPSIISDIYDTLNEEGQTVRMMDITHPSGSKTVTLSDELYNTDISIGDIIQFQTNAKNVVQAVEVLFDVSLGHNQTRVQNRGGNGGYHNLYYNFRTMYGTLVSFENNIYTHTTSVKEDPDGVEAFNELHNYKHNGTVIYVYRNNNGKPTVSQGSAKDLVTYAMDPDTNQKAAISIQRGGHIQYVLVIVEEA